MDNIDNYIQLANINFCCNCRVKKRIQNNVWGRFAVYVAMRSSGYTLKRIAIEFNTTHANIIHGLNKHEILYNSDKQYTQMFNKFKELTEHEKFTAKDRLIKLIQNLPDNVDLLDSITNHIIRKQLN